MPPTTRAEPATIRLVILACAVKKCAKTRLETNWMLSRGARIEAGASAKAMKLITEPVMKMTVPITLGR